MAGSARERFLILDNGLRVVGSRDYADATAAILAADVQAPWPASRGRLVVRSNHDDGGVVVADGGGRVAATREGGRWSGPDVTAGGGYLVDPTMESIHGRRYNSPQASKTTVQIRREIAEALAAPRVARQPLRVRLTKGLGQAIKRHSGVAVFDALENTTRGYLFESDDPGVVRAFWFATGDVLHRPATRVIGDAVVKLRSELRPIIETLWPEVLVA